MKQRINLASKLTSSERISLTWKQITRILAIWSLILVSIAFIIYLLPVKKLNQQKGMSKANSQIQVLQDNINALEAIKTQLLSKRVNKEEKAQVLQGFSKELSALTQGFPQGVWLKTIRVNRVTQDIRLTGYMVSREKLPEFLKFLQQSPAFKSTSFHLVTLKPEDKKDYFYFELSSGGNKNV